MGQVHPRGVHHQGDNQEEKAIDDGSFHGFHHVEGGYHVVIEVNPLQSSDDARHHFHFMAL